MVWLPVFGNFNEMSMHAIAHGGYPDTVRESALEVDSGSKMRCRTRDSNPSQYCSWLFSRTLYQLSYSCSCFLSLCISCACARVCVCMCVRISSTLSTITPPHTKLNLKKYYETPPKEVTAQPRMAPRTPEIFTLERARHLRGVDNNFFSHSSVLSSVLIGRLIDIVPP